MEDVLARPLEGLGRRNAVREFTAGLTLLAIAVPLNIGYAQIAGLPPTAGLYALVLPAAVYALTVSSRQVVASPDAAAAALVGSSLAGLAAAGAGDYMAMALAQAILIGAMFFLAAVFKLGFLANFFSKPILVGFVAGLALDILVSQIAKMLGVHIDSGEELVGKLTGLVTNLGDVDAWSVVISAVAVVVLLAGKRIAPAAPWALIVLVLATILVILGDLRNAGVDVLGEVPPGPPALTWPLLTWTAWLVLVPSAMAITMVTMAEGLLVSRSYAERRGYPDDPNRNLFALGLGNVAAGATGGFAVGASMSRTAAMDQAGSRTQLPSLVTAAGALLLLLFGTALLTDVPSPAIGAVVAVAIIPLLGIREFAVMWRLDRSEFAVGIVCFVVTLMVGSIAGIVVAFVLALINLARRAARPALDVLAAGQDPADSLLDPAPSGSVSAPGVLVVRLAAPLFFANATSFGDAAKRAILDAPEPVRTIVLDCESITDLDLTAAEAFESFRAWLRERNVSLAMSRMRPQVRRRFAKFGLLGDVEIHPTNRAALAAETNKEAAVPNDDEEGTHGPHHR